MCSKHDIRSNRYYLGQKVPGIRTGITRRKEKKTGPIASLKNTEWQRQRTP